MADDEMAGRIKRLEDEIADLKAVHEAGEYIEEEGRRDAEQADEPFGIERLRGVQRKTDLPNKETSDD